MRWLRLMGIIVTCLAILDLEFVCGYSAGKKAADKWYAAHRPPVILLQIDASDPAICGHTLTLKDLELWVPKE